MRELKPIIGPVLHVRGDKTQRLYNTFAVVSGAILLLGWATGTAGANDRIAPTITVPPAQAAPIIQENGSASDNVKLNCPVGAPSCTTGSNESSTNSTRYEGGKWNNSSVITWSLADRPGTPDSPFSGYMGSQYEVLVQQAFQTWASASGLTFELVADSSQSDIRLGWGDFNTSSTGVVGNTTCEAESGELQPGAIIRLEDPSQNSLVIGEGNSLTYSGTIANLYQVTLHEIGHALGLADNNDPTSVMYYQATGANNTLASSDVAGIRRLYGSPALATRILQAAASAPSSGRTKQLETTPSVPGKSPLRTSTLH